MIAPAAKNKNEKNRRRKRDKSRSQQQQEVESQPKPQPESGTQPTIKPLPALSPEELDEERLSLTIAQIA